MADKIQLPNGAFFPVKEGESKEQALSVAKQLYPDAFAPPVADKPKEDTSGFKAAMSAGATRLGGQAELLKGKLGIKSEAEAQKEYEAAEKKASERFTPTEKGFTEAPFLKFKELLGGSVPSMALPAAAGLAALTLPVSGPVAAGLGLLGAGAVSAGQFTASNLGAQVDTGKSLEEASLGKAAAAAVPQALINTAAMALIPGIGKLFGSVGAKLTTEQAKAIASQTLGKTVMDYTLKTGVTAGREGVTEATQQLLERLQAGLSITDPEARKEYIESFVGGAVLGGTLAPVGRAIERSGARSQAAQAEQQEQADAAAAAEAAKNQPDALRQLSSDFSAADQQLKAINAQLAKVKPGKGATAEQKQAYADLKAKRDELLVTYKPLRQEYEKRKGAIDQLEIDRQTALEVETAAGQEAAKAPIPAADPQLDVQRLMDEQQQLRNQLGQLEGQLAQAAPEQFDSLNAQRQDLQRRIDARATLIEERGGSPLAQAQFQQATSAKMQAIDTRLEKLNAAYTTALENRDYDAAAKAKDELLALRQERETLTAKTAQQMQALQEQQLRGQQRGQTLDMFAEAPAAPTTDVDAQLKQQTLEEEANRGLYGPASKIESAKQAFGEAGIGPRGQLETTTPQQEAKAQTGIKPKQLALVEETNEKVAAAETALTEAAKTKDTQAIYAAADAVNQAKSESSRAQDEVGRGLFRPVVLDIFSPANILNTAIQNGDTKLINDIATHANTMALRAALDEKKSERDTLINVLENRAGLGGEEKATETGEPLKSIKRERADLFSQQYEPKQQALFKNGTYPDRELQALYDKGGPAAVEYENVMRAIEGLSKQVTTKQGNAKKSLYEQLVDLAAQHAALVAQMESGVATPTLREKTAGLQAKLGKGEAPAARQMDAKEKFDLQRRIDNIVNKYRLTEGQITSVRDQILKLYNSLYVITPLEKTSKAADRKAIEAEEKQERSKPLQKIADKYGMDSPQYKEAMAKQVAESKAAGRVPKVAKSRTAATATRINSGNVRKEAESSQKMRDLAYELGQREPEYQKFEQNLMRRFDALKKRYGPDDKAVSNFRANMGKQRLAKATELGSATPEYKATLKEQIKYFQKTLANVSAVVGEQKAPTKRTGQVTRKQSSAPNRLVSSSPESREQSAAEDRSVRLRRGSLKEYQEGVDSEKEGREEERFLRGVETESVELDSTTVSLLKQNDIRSALTRVGNDSRVDTFSRTIAKLLTTFLDKTNVKLVDNLADGDGKEALGAATSKLVELNTNGGLSVETLLHEGTHAAAERIVQLAETNPDLLTKEQKLAINELKAIHARVKTDPGITSKNAKGSLSEFVAEVMSNRNLQKQLAQRKWQRSSMWKGIKSVIMRMLGVKDVETMFGASAVAIEQLFVPSSVRNLGRRTAPETRVTRNLSTKDIAALDDGSNSMKQFAAQFGDRIKQKDRTPEDVERIADQAIDEMLASVADAPLRTGAPRLKSVSMAERDARRAASVVALPTADSLDYKGMITMSDGKPYDENNPLHYVEATPATFAALQAVNDPQLREREADAITEQRRKDFQSLGDYLQANYKNYTTVETALVLKAAAKYGVISGSNGRLKLVEIGKDNRHNIAVLGKETADAIIEQLRAGKGLKQAFLDGLQKNADDNAKNNERKNGWKKFDQTVATYDAQKEFAFEEYEAHLEGLYTDAEIDTAFDQTGYDGAAFANNAALIDQLILDGFLDDRRTMRPPGQEIATNNKSVEEAAIALNEGCAGTPWCTGASVGTARGQIEEGDFYVYYNKGRPEVAVRMDGQDRIGEVRGNNPNQALDPAQQQIAADFLRAKKFKEADEYLSEFERREALVKLAKGETTLGVKDLLGEESIVNSKGKVQSSELGDLLRFPTIDGYRNRPDPVQSVIDFFGKQYLDAATRAYENNEFVFSDILLNENANSKSVEVEFAGKKYSASTADIKALNQLTISAYSYGLQDVATVVLPKLTRVGTISMFRGELDLPTLKTVNDIIFFTNGLGGKAVARVKLPADARVEEVRGGFGENASGTIAGPQTVNLVTLTRGGGGLTLDLPDTKYVAVADDQRSVANAFASKAEDAVDDMLKAQGIGFADIMRANRGEATPEKNDTYQTIAKRELKKFFNALEKTFGYEAYEHALNNIDTAEAYRKTYHYRMAFKYAVEDVLELNKYSRKAFDKMAKVIKDSTGAEVAYPEGKLIAPKRVGDPPYGAEFTEAPEERRFAPKDVGVQKDKQGGFSFARKQVNSSSVVAREPGVVDTVLGNMLGLAGRVQFIDQYAALEAATKKGLSAGVISSLEATNANYLLRFGQQRSQFSGQFLTNGPVKAEITRKNGGTETLYRSTKGTSMVDVAKALNKAKLSNDVEQENMFTLYVAGKRAQQVGWDKLNFSSPAQAKAEYDAVIARLNINDTAKKAFEDAAKLYQEYNAGLLDFLAQTGALSDKKVAELKAISYVPFYRVNNNGEVQLMVDKERPVRIANIKDQPQLKELIGGNTAILPIFTSAAQNTFMLTGMGLRNQAVKETSFMLQKLGIASRVAPGNGPTGANVVRFFKKGEPYYALIDTDAYGVPAELIVRGMEGIKTTMPAVIKLLGIPANWLRSFVVRNPAYAVRQIIRDPLNAWMTTGTDAVPVLSSMKELAKMVAGRSDAERKLMETGAISSNVYSGDDQDMAKFLKDMSAGKSGWDKATAMLDTFALQGDAATRAVIYKDSLAKGMSEQEALLRTLESMNFSRRGVSPSMQALSTLIPFFNAQVQGLDVIYRAFKGDMPYSQQLDIRGKMVRRGLMLAAGTIAYAALMEDDEAYQRAKPEERLANWFVYVPGIDEPVRVPIPFEMGFLFKALPEAVYAMAMQDGKTDAALNGLSKLAMQTIPLALPQAVKPITEAILGKSFYSGDIESVREKDVLATERYRDSSTELAKTIGSVTGKVGLSPITIDYLIRGYTGGLGIALVQLANPILASSDKVEVAEPTTKLSKQPFIGGLFQPVEGRGTLDEAYDRMKEIQQVKGTYNDMVEKGRRAEAMAFAQEYSDKLSAASVSGSVQKRLGELAKMERQIKGSPNLTTEQKDMRLEQLDKMKTALARQFLAATDQR